MRPRAMWFFYAVWVAVCLLSFITSTLLGFVTIAVGIALRMLEEAVRLLQELLAEQRLMRFELRAHRSIARDDARN